MGHSLFQSSKENEARKASKDGVRTTHMLYLGFSPNFIQAFSCQRSVVHPKAFGNGSWGSGGLIRIFGSRVENAYVNIPQASCICSLSEISASTISGGWKSYSLNVLSRSDLIKCLVKVYYFLLVGFVAFSIAVRTLWCHQYLTWVFGARLWHWQVTAEISLYAVWSSTWPFFLACM